VTSIPGNNMIDASRPTVAQLAARYGVGKGTIGKVLRALADDGLVRIVPRRGTFRV
jgi:DNA-binding GntR family transcriptional regulator